MKRLEELLDGTGSVLITGHVRPDGDCVGACLAARAYILRVRPETAVTVCLEPFPSSFGFLPGSETAVPAVSGPFDLALALDASSYDRMTEGVREAFDGARRTFCIDHHITNTHFAQESLVAADASSTCEVLFGLMDERLVTKEIADCLYLGIVHDTGVFKHSNTSEATMRAAGRLISLGAVPSRIIDDTFYRKTFTQNRLLGRALLQAETAFDGTLVLSHISWEDLRTEGAGSQDVEGIIDQLRVTAGCRTAAFLYELSPGSWKVSLRSNDETDVAAAASVFGGGGHKKAAGCSLEGSLAEVREKLTEALLAAMKEC